MVEYRLAPGHSMHIPAGVAYRERFTASLAEVAHVSLICSSDEARQRFKQIEELGFDEVLLVSPTAAVEEIERGATSSRPMLCPHTVIYSNA